MTGVYVVTCTEQGWDCVNGVFASETGAIRSIIDSEYEYDHSDEALYAAWENLKRQMPYVIHYKTLEA